MVNLNCEYLPLHTLKPYARNARTHSKKQVKQIADSIRRFGFTNPILVDRENMILAGHGRVEAAKLLGMAEVPCVRLEHMTAKEKRAYVLADNKLALNAGWDEEILAEELKGLLEVDLDFDIGLTGFSIAEIDSLVEGLIPQELGDPDDDITGAVDGAPRCRPGDIWQLGPHRLTCGSALERDVVSALMNGEKAEMVFSDPPYNVPIDGHVGGSGAIKHRLIVAIDGSGDRTSDPCRQGVGRAYRFDDKGSSSAASGWAGAARHADGGKSRIDAVLGHAPLTQNSDQAGSDQPLKRVIRADLGIDPFLPHARRTDQRKSGMGRIPVDGADGRPQSARL